MSGYRMNRLISISGLIVMPYFILHMSGCASGSYAAKGAKEGATTGAVSGAVGGLVSALVFGGDPIERAARGAVYGGAVGATAGAMSGSRADEQIQQQNDASLDKLREEIGDDSYTGLEALADCNHKKALSQATIAQQDKNPNHKLAGVWLEVLTYADSKDEAKARAMFPVLVEQDWDIKSEAQAEETMRKALNDLMDIRQAYNMKRVCA